jgi:uncharacterized protein (TIGR00369 family)
VDDEAIGEILERRDRARRERGPIPAWVTAGLEEPLAAPRRSEQRCTVPAWMHDASGSVPPGALAILGDAALGSAVMSTMPIGWAMATSHLHLELLGAISGGTTALSCTGEQRWVDDRFGLAEGDIGDDHGVVIAKVTMGAVVLHTPAHHERPPMIGAEPPGRPHPVAAASPVLTELGAAVVSVERSGVRMLTVARDRFANTAGGLHGGFGVLMGERTLDVALQAALPDERVMRPVELRAAFLRPIVADGTPIECGASVIHLGRRLAAARGEVCDHRGRPAVLVDATYLAV